MRSLYVGERDVVDFSMVLAITAASVGHVIVGLKGSEARVRLLRVAFYLCFYPGLRMITLDGKLP